MESVVVSFLSLGGSPLPLSGGMAECPGSHKRDVGLSPLLSRAGSDPSQSLTEQGVHSILKAGVTVEWN